MPLTNETILAYSFLQPMYDDGYYPDAVVDRVKAVLVDLCQQIEETRPADDDALLALTHQATERINDLQDDFYAAGSEIETVAREAICEDFAIVVEAYGFGHLEDDDITAPRDW